MRALGNDYLKSEFRRHQQVTERRYLDPFFREWQQYAQHLDQATVSSSATTTTNTTTTTTASTTTASTMPLEAVGKKLDPQKLDRFSNEQLGQLYELRNEAKNVGRTTPADDENLNAEVDPKR